MGVQLPEIERSEFAERLRLAAGRELPEGAEERLYQHYLELRRWSSRVALVGAGTRARVVEVHYGESLAAAELIPADAVTLVDVGSGAGFPGLVLAAARPDLDVTLIEPRQRKWSFLLSAARRMSLACNCLNARVSDALPDGFPERVDLVTVRALKLSDGEAAALVERMSKRSRLITWSGAELRQPPAGLALDTSRSLGGGARGHVVSYRLLDSELRREP